MSKRKESKTTARKDAKGTSVSSLRKGEAPGTRVLKRSMFYAVSLFVVFQLMLVPLQMSLYPAFWMIALAGLGVVLAELLYSRLSEMRTPIHFDSVHVRDTRWREHFLHHALLPGILYLSGTLFLFFNRVRVLDQVAVLILCGVFFAVFYNIGATYLRMYTISRETRVVFDCINIIVFYFFTDVLINLVLYEGLSKYYVFGGVGLMTFILIGLMITMTRQSSLSVFLALTGTALVAGLIVLFIWHMPVFNIAVISIVATIPFYMADVYWHHRLEGSFSWDVMSQYALFALMAIILLLYL